MAAKLLVYGLIKELTSGQSFSLTGTGSEFQSLTALAIKVRHPSVCRLYHGQ